MVARLAILKKKRDEARELFNSAFFATRRTCLPRGLKEFDASFLTMSQLGTNLLKTQSSLYITKVTIISFLLGPHICIWSLATPYLLHFHGPQVEKGFLAFLTAIGHRRRHSLANRRSSPDNRRNMTALSLPGSVC